MILPKGYASAFINRYIPPEPAPTVALIDTNITVVKEEDISEGKTPEVQEELKVPIETVTQKSRPEHDVNTTVSTLKSTTEKEVSKTSGESRYIVDAKSMKLIDAKSAYYVIGGRTYGIMSPTGKFAFASKEAAEAFIRQYGGSVVDYKTANEADLKESMQE